jgi:diketogulonate reductase-like aldo/keto reductase
MLKTITLPSGEQVPTLGQGTWMMAARGKRESDIKALRLGIDLGMTLIDTAEMYGEGNVETLVGEAIADIRDEIFLISKVYPYNASRRGIIQACERSLERLGTDRLDLYLLHWRGNVPLEETILGFEALRAAGKIRHWGVSNFDTDDMQELTGLAHGNACATNQILYNLSRRGCEFELAPWLRDHKIPLMAYSPVEQGRLLVKGALAEVARDHGVTPYQAAIAWLLQKPNVIVIPKSGSDAHVRDNRAAADIVLAPDDLAKLDAAFPPPAKRKPLESL